MENLDYVDKPLNDPINSEDEDYIMRRMRADYLYDSTVTIFLVGEHSSESRGAYEQRFIKRELQASLYSSEAHAKNGILGVVLPGMQDRLFGGSIRVLNVVARTTLYPCTTARLFRSSAITTTSGTEGVPTLRMSDIAFSFVGKISKRVRETALSARAKSELRR